MWFSVWKGARQFHLSKILNNTITYNVGRGFPVAQHLTLHADGLRARIGLHQQQCTQHTHTQQRTHPSAYPTKGCMVEVFGIRPSFKRFSSPPIKKRLLPEGKFAWLISTKKLFSSTFWKCRPMKRGRRLCRTFYAPQLCDCEGESGGFKDGFWISAPCFGSALVRKGRVRYFLVVFFNF